MGLPKGLTPRIAELGKIKIGYLGEERKSKGGGLYRLPLKLDYFLITGNERGQDGRLVVDTTLMDSLKEQGLADPDGKLRKLPIYLLSDDPDEVLQAAYVSYDGKRRLATCDGATVKTYYKGATKLVGPALTPCTGEHEHPPWKVHCNLSCVIASGAARFGGVYRLRTTSVISTQQLYGGLLHIMTLTGGILTGIPLRLVVRPMQVAPDGKPTTVYVVHIELHALDLADVQRQALDAAVYRAKHHAQIQAAQRQYTALLTAPGDESPDEIDDIVAEFHPPKSVVADGRAEAIMGQLTSQPVVASKPDPETPQDPPAEEPDREPGDDDEPYEEATS